MSHDALSMTGSASSRRMIHRRWLTEELVVTDIDALVDGIDEPGEVDRDDNEQTDGGSPVDTTFVSVDTLVLV